jgi:maltose O-acetyltransferase
MLYPFVRKIYYLLLETKKRRYIEHLRKKGLKLGKNVDIVDQVFLDPSHCYLISIGDNCTICPNVRLIAHDASTKKNLGYTKLGKVEIKENCFIGDSAIILPGVRIGPNSIVGAGAVVTKDIPPNTVTAGNPAKVISSIEEYIHKIRSISSSKKVFDENYFINNLDKRKTKELVESVGESIGFIK